MFGQFYKLEDFEYICHCLFSLSDFCSFFIDQFTGDMLIYKWNTWKNIVSTQSQKITLVPNFVRHKSVQLSSMALEIIAPCKSFTVNSRNHKTNWSVLPTPIPWQLHFFQCRCKYSFESLWRFFWYAAHYNKDDNVQINNALIWVLEKLIIQPSYVLTLAALISVISIEKCKSQKSCRDTNLSGRLGFFKGYKSQL